MFQINEEGGTISGSDEEVVVLKIKGQFVKRIIADDIILVPVGETALRFNGMITLTETASEIWDELEKGATRDALIRKLTDSFEIDEKTVAEDVDEFLTTLRKNSFLEETQSSQ